MLRIRCVSECLFRTRQSSLSRSGLRRLSRIFLWQELSRRAFSGRFFTVTPRNPISRPSASAGYNRSRCHHFTSLLKQFQNSVCPCTFCSIHGWTYVDCGKDNAHFSGDHSIVHRSLLRRIVECIWLQYVSPLIYPIWRFKPHGSHSYLGFCELGDRRRPFFGWGYQSFWLVGPDSPSIVDAPGWVKMMPNAHNGYYDTMLELGYVGLTLLVTFITATLHAIGRVVDLRPRRAWLVLSLALFIIIYDFLESEWMRGFEFLWVVFADCRCRHWSILASRYWQTFRPDDRNVSSTLPRTTRSRWFLIRSSSIVMTSRLSVSSAMAAHFSWPEGLYSVRRGLPGNGTESNAEHRSIDAEPGVILGIPKSVVE